MDEWMILSSKHNLLQKHGDLSMFCCNAPDHSWADTILLGRHRNELRCSMRSSSLAYSQADHAGIPISLKPGGTSFSTKYKFT